MVGDTSTQPSCARTGGLPRQTNATRNMNCQVIRLMSTRPPMLEPVQEILGQARINVLKDLARRNFSLGENAQDRGGARIGNAAASSCWRSDFSWKANSC